MCILTPDSTWRYWFKFVTAVWLQLFFNNHHLVSEFRSDMPSNYSVRETSVAAYENFDDIILNNGRNNYREENGYQNLFSFFFASSFADSLG